MKRFGSTLLAIWLVAAVLSGYLGFTVWKARAAAESTAKNRALAMTRLVAEHATARFEQADMVLLGALDHLTPVDFIGARTLPEARRQIIQSSLIREQKRASGIVSMSITDADGYVFANTVGAKPGVNLGDRAYFLELKQGNNAQPAVSNAIKGRVSNRWGVQVARRFDLPDGRFGGMIVANLGLEESFNDFYRSIGFERDLLITLRSPSNQILVRFPHIESIVGTVAPGSKMADAVLGGEPESVVYSLSAIDHIERITGIKKLPRFPVFANVGISTGVAFATWQTEVRLALLVILGIVTAASAATIALRRRDTVMSKLNKAHHELQNAHDQLNRERTKLEESQNNLTIALSLAEKNASHDELTGLWNRRTFDQRLNEAIARAKRDGPPICLLMMDLDHFKTINDCFGHHIGDSVLKEFALLITARKRESDFFARWGGEEFILLLDNALATQAVVVAHEFCQAVAQHAFVGIETLTVSIGIAEYRPGDDTQTLLVRADRALYQSKANGRNRYSMAESESP